ncbi:hypothetical protein yberc0001_19950 [Yersinia bercovieri ATCC 43970]|uniref:Uncharacterized protein n=1 Tax=Yersinia bercovieri ATCC 43970 TaxID=349968 RepID=A0ABP2E9L7_YERBE|nr:hypothetical protein yberc0001_19950 [Yersinia bercovieri ATCC 43970]
MYLANLTAEVINCDCKLILVIKAQPQGNRSNRLLIID